MDNYVTAPIRNIPSEYLRCDLFLRIHFTPHFHPKPHNVLGQERGAAVSSIKDTLRTVRQPNDIQESLPLFSISESLYGKMPLTKKRAHELGREVVETKVIASCSVREEIKSRCKSIENIELRITRIALEFGCFVCLPHFRYK